MSFNTRSITRWKTRKVLHITGERKTLGKDSSNGAAMYGLIEIMKIKAQERENSCST